MKKITILFILSYGLNSYCQTIIIGTQIWQTRNLDVTTYRDGTPIPQVTDPTAWANLTTGAWCYYNNDAANNATYGKLYNLYAAAGIYDAASLGNPTLRKNLAPPGYHVPSDEEWTTLITYLGGANIAGGKMKETGTANWNSPNVDATNSSGFTALPGGFRHSNGEFRIIGTQCWMWSSSEYIEYGRIEALASFSGGTAMPMPYHSCKEGCIVRCLSDSSLSNATFETIGLKLYPNPALNLLNLSFNDAFCLDKITIVDITGKVVLEQTENSSTINVEKLAKGVYILTAYAGDNKYQEKFIKE